MRIPTIGRSTIIIGFALLSGLCAALGAQHHIQGKVKWLQEQARIPEETRLVVAYDLNAGTVLDSDQLAVRSYPVGLAPSDSLKPDAWRRMQGRVLRQSLRAGDLLLPAHADVKKNDVFSTQLAAGRRAITMPVDVVNAVSGLLTPGDLIDLYVSFDYQRRRVTAPLLQGVLVLATGAVAQGQADMENMRDRGYTTVTLDAAPEDAVKLVAARQSGVVTAVLRHPDDHQSSQKAARGDLASLLGIGAQAVATGNRRAQVIYGNRAVRSVAGLRPTAIPRTSSGLFDLPYVPVLSSSRARDDNAQGLASMTDPDQMSYLDALAIEQDEE
jgi:pilus assembly protein CpaB